MKGNEGERRKLWPSRCTVLYRLYCWLKVSIDAKKDGVLTTQNKRRDRRRVWVVEGCVKVCTNGWYAWAISR
jgi:hypothetical protein